MAAKLNFAYIVIWAWSWHGNTNRNYYISIDRQTCNGKKKFEWQPLKSAHVLFSAMNFLIQSAGYTAPTPPSPSPQIIRPSSEKIIQKGLLLAYDVNLPFDLASVYFCTAGHGLNSWFLEDQVCACYKELLRGALGKIEIKLSMYRMWGE